MNRNIIKFIIKYLRIYFKPKAKAGGSFHVLLPSLLYLQKLLLPSQPSLIPPQQTLFIQAILPTWLSLHLKAVKKHLYNGLSIWLLTDPETEVLLVLIQDTDEDLYFPPHLHPQDKLAVKPCVTSTELHGPVIHIQYEGLLGQPFLCRVIVAQLQG